VGLSQLLCVDWFLAWYVVSSEVGLNSLSHPWGGELSAYGGPSVFIWSNIWLCALLSYPRCHL